MRRPIRPFIREFKNHSSKSLASHLQTPDDADKISSKHPFLGLGVFAASKSNHDGEYQAALKAAHEVIGKSSPAAPIQAEAPLSNAPVGRVLPSLIDGDDALAVRSEEADKKSRSDRRGGHAKSSSSTRREKPALPRTSEMARISAEVQEDVNSSPEILIVPTPRRERSSIQKRWVLKTELKAGQKWKQRLCEPAR